MKVLLLAGTAEARQIAAALHEAKVDTVSSLAGVTDRPAVLSGLVRTGGFGGVAGLVDFIRANHISHVLDATHPFAAQMSRHAQVAAEETGVPLLQVCRPEWPENDRWHIVPSLKAAAAALRPNSRVFLSTGRGSLSNFTDRPDVHFLARVIDDRPGKFPLSQGAFVIGNPPFSVEEEMQALTYHRVDTLVARNSGGTGGAEKLIAAERLGVTIVMVSRPALPDADRVQNVEDALLWIAAQ